MASDWQKVRVAEFGEIVTGSTPATKNPLFWDGEYPFYSPADFEDEVVCSETERYITSAGLQIGRPIPSNSVLFTCIGSIGKMAVSGSFGLTNQQINSIIPDKSRFDHLFLFYLLYHFRNRFINSAPMTTIQIINKTEFGKFHFKVPPLPQQRKIARILSTCDAVIEKTEAAIAKYRALKQGLMHDLFTRGIDLSTGRLRPKYEEAPELYKESELGWIPKEWEVKRLETILEVSSGEGLTSSTLRPGDFPVYGGNGINGYHAEFLYKEKKLILGRVGEYCGHARITRPYSWITDNALVVRSNAPQFNLEFWSLYLNFLDLNSRAYAAAQPVITGGTLKKIAVADIPADEQKEVTSRIVALDKKIISEESALSKYRQMKAGLMQDLLTPPAAGQDGKVGVTAEASVTENE